MATGVLVRATQALVGCWSKKPNEMAGPVMGVRTTSYSVACSVAGRGVAKEISESAVRSSRCTVLLPDTVNWGTVTTRSPVTVPLLDVSTKSAMAK